MVKLTSTFAALLAGASAVFGASLQQVNNFGTNPTNVRMYIYVPDKIASSTNAPILVAAHYCTGTAQAYFSGTPYRQLADQHGFIVIYPNAPDSGGCWDVHTQATFTHNGGGDSRGIASMVTYTLDKYKANPDRVFVTGTSSGAMMTQVLMGAYPDLFKGGAAFAGVPFGCFGGAGMWNSQCATGQQSRTAQAWGDLVRNAYPGT
jgi:acetylxylan esterase